MENEHLGIGYRIECMSVMMAIESFTCNDDSNLYQAFSREARGYSIAILNTLLYVDRFSIDLLDNVTIYPPGFSEECQKRAFELQTHE